VGIHTGSIELGRDWVDYFQPSLTGAATLSYEDFSRAALYHPDMGYYRSKRTRVGKSPQSDFYTASHHGLVFPKLIAAALSQLLIEQELSYDHFYELAAEPDQNIWEGIQLPAEALKFIRLGDKLDIANSSIVYSNELFDAQPFQRWIATGGAWKPIHLKFEANSVSESVYDGVRSAEEERVTKLLPVAPAFEYHLDLSLAAVDLLEEIVAQDWKGLFVAIDYGMSWQQIISETPQGTARAYANHQQKQILFENPGGQDLTTHVCWDHLEAVLESNGFQNIRCTTLSRFLLENAQSAMEQIVRESDSLTSKAKSQLLELISPAFFGQKFQVLTAVRK
jgi:SAM-dependent MidA family methyltransferase